MSYYAEQQADALRPLRMFVGALAGGAAGYYDNTYAYQDAYANSYPGRYQSIGPYGVGIEGLPVALTSGGGLVLSPGLLLVGLGALAVLFWKK